MNNILSEMERLFMAVTYAEAGEWEFAAKLANVSSPHWMEKIKSALKYLECCFAASAFAEANCPEHCVSFLNEDKKSQKTLKSFLEDIGLYNVPISYGVASI